jgi:pyrroline-5-carboxylate reductase
MKRFGFIGLGNMGGAIARGLANAGSFELHGFDPSEAMCDKNADIMAIHKTAGDVAKHSDFVLLAVKPQVMKPVLEGFAESIGPETCLVSIAAGITVAQLTTWSGGACPVVRVMPNTPAMVGKGVYALCFDHDLVNEDVRATVFGAFDTIGKTHVLPERLFDAYTGLIGSGPAYVFAFMEGLIDAGVTLGLTRAQATDMVTGLVGGCALMAEPDGAHPTLLKEMVTSPGGTTIAGLNALDEHRFKFALSQAVQAAARRSRELAD